MSASDDRTAEVLALIEQVTDIAIDDTPLVWDTFARVLYEIGVTALADEEEHGEPSPDTVTALQVIAAAFERVQAREVEAG